MLRLTNVQAKILSLILKGFTHQEIAHKLNIEVATVQNHLSNIRKKFEVKGQWGLLKRAVEFGLLHEDIQLFLSDEITLKESEILTLTELIILRRFFSDESIKLISSSNNTTEYKIQSIVDGIKKKWEVDSSVDFLLKAIQKHYIRVTPLILFSMDNFSNESLLNAFKHVRSQEYQNQSKELQSIYKLDDSVPHRTLTKMPEKVQIVARLRLKGHSNPFIAAKLNLNLKTVYAYYTEFKSSFPTHKERTPQRLVDWAILIGIVSLYDMPTIRIPSLEQEHRDIILAYSKRPRIEKVAKELKVPVSYVSMILDRIKKEWGVDTAEGIYYRAIMIGELNPKLPIGNNIR